MPRVDEVFGVTPGEIPLYTYVVRKDLDDQFEDFLSKRRKHIVIYGASKQGKTTLRKKYLPDEEAIVVHCRPDSTVESLYRDILSQLDAWIQTTHHKEATESKENSVKGGVGAHLGIFEASGSGGHTSGSGASESDEWQPINVDETSLRYVAGHIKSSGFWCVIEDFHYLSEEQKRRLAHDLHGFGDLKAFFIIVGVWHDQNLLTYYNPDLRYRYDEIPLKWTATDLTNVMKQGETVLQIQLDPRLRNEGFVQNAWESVGLLQELALRYCQESGIYGTVVPPSMDLRNDRNALDRAIRKVCETYTQQYRKFAEAMVQGFTEESKLKVYENIARVCVEASVPELKEGLYKDTLLDRIQKYMPETRSSDLSSALGNLDRLQVAKDITPLVISYESNSQRVRLVDQELLFFRKHSKYSWPWQQRK